MSSLDDFHLDYEEADDYGRLFYLVTRTQQFIRRWRI